MDTRHLKAIVNRHDRDVEAHRQEVAELEHIIKIWFLVAVVVSLIKICIGGG